MSGRSGRFGRLAVAVGERVRTAHQLVRGRSFISFLHVAEAEEHVDMQSSKKLTIHAAQSAECAMQGPARIPRQLRAQPPDHRNQESSLSMRGG